MSDKRQPASNIEPEASSQSSSKICLHCGAALADGSQLTTGSQSSMSSSATQAASISSHTGEGLTKWEQDTFRDILNNANNTLRFQVQLAVPLLAGCVTALNIIPPQAHQELLNLLDRWVFIPVLLSMGVAYFGLEMHWNVHAGIILDNVESLSGQIKKKYHMVHLAIMLQAVGLILLMIFVLLEYK